MIAAGDTYVALGSSFAAGPGIRPIEHRRAGRSARNYAHQVADALSLHLVDVTCSGATTANVLTERQRRLPPQIDGVTADAKLVTITVGGNDIGYIGGLVRGSVVNAVLDRLRFLPDRWRGSVRYEAPTDQCDTLVESLVMLVRAVRSRAPGARILLVDYLTVLGPDAHRCRELPLGDDAVRQVRTTADRLAAAFRTAAQRSGAHLVPASAASVDHGVGSADPWVSGFHGKPPYHPTLAGMTAVADLILRSVR
jgi:lysophospholipase L1-like esterase